MSVGPSGVKVNNALVTVTDVLAENGVIHIIDTVLMPPTSTGLGLFPPHLIPLQ